MLDYYTGVLKNYAGFEGRARRAEFWQYGLMNLIVVVVLVFLSAIIKPLFFLVIIYYLAILVPTLAVTVRRLHDTDRSGFWFFISFVPFVGGIILLVFECLDSTPGDNKYGPNPKGVGGPAGGYPGSYAGYPTDAPYSG